MPFLFNIGFNNGIPSLKPVETQVHMGRVYKQKCSAEITCNAFWCPFKTNLFVTDLFITGLL